MSLIDSVGDLLKQYGIGGSSNPTNATEHFDTVAKAASPDMIADGLAAVFRSNQTPAFGNLVSNLFSQSNGEQKAGLLNQLMSSISPEMLSQLAGSGVLAGLLKGGGGEITPAQAQAVSPDVVQQLASHAETADPSIIDKASSFFAQHPTLIKTLGGAALSIALAKVAERQKAA
jgi:hypothetical protein